MNKATDEWRKTRMAELSKKVGSNAELGRLLGYKDGAYVRQMIAGERPITEKTVAKAEALKGCAGWFAVGGKSGAHVPPPAAPAPDFRDTYQLTPDQWELFQAFSIAATSEEKKTIIERYESLKQIAAQVYGAKNGAGK